MRHTVRAFTVFLATISTAAAFIAAALLFYRPVADRIMAEQAAELDRLLMVMAKSATSGNSASLPLEFMVWSLALEGSGYRLSLIGSGGELAADSPPGHVRADTDQRGDRPEVLAALDQGYGSSLRYSDNSGGNYLYVARRLDFANDDGRRAVLRLGAPYSPMGGLKGDIFKKFALAACVSTVFAFVFSLVATLELKGEFKLVNEMARDLAEGRPARPIQRHPKNDLGDLGLDLNRIAERLENAEAF